MSAFNKSAMPLNRRHALMFLGANAWAMRPAWADAQASAPGRLVLVFLRGAYDGISALVPHGDAQYYKLRPSIAIARPSLQVLVDLVATIGHFTETLTVAARWARWGRIPQ